MTYAIKDDLRGELEEIEQAGLLKRERELTTPQAAHVSTVAGEALNFCANNYLGLADHPDVLAAARDALEQWGFGMASVRFICGTQTQHTELERRLAEFVGQEAAILYSSCFDANGGLFEVLFGADDAIISDALNHASIIDGVRLSKAKRFRYANADMADLRTQLEAMSEQRGEIKRLQADNVAMYEKVRYLQNYGKSAPTEMPYPPTARGDTESAYRARYEQSINPFEVFRGQEQSRALASLSPVDRLLHVFTSAVLGNAQMRLVFVCYAVVLHLLVFGILLDVGHRAVEAQ